MQADDILDAPFYGRGQLQEQAFGLAGLSVFDKIVERQDPQDNTEDTDRDIKDPSDNPEASELIKKIKQPQSDQQVREKYGENKTKPYHDQFPFSVSLQGQKRNEEDNDGKGARIHPIY